MTIRVREDDGVVANFALLLEIEGMAHLIKIGNSQGIRIPKILIEQARLEGKELEFEVFGEGLLVLPSRKPRAGWKEAIEEKLATTQGAEMADAEWLDATLTDDETLEW